MTKTLDFTSTIIFNQNPETAYNAIQQFRLWWSEEIEGPSDALNATFFYHYKDIHLCKMKLIETVKNQKLVYEVIENQFSFIKDQTEWVGTKLVFEIKPIGNQTQIVFTHQGLVPSYECYQVCFDAWTGYIQNSLHSLISKGKGQPNPKDADGFNAELAKKWQLN